MTSTVFIDGEAGTTGLGIRERLKDVAGVTVKSIAHAHRKDPVARKAMMADVDAVILCLPDDAAIEAVALADELGANAPRILDASTAHRLAHGWVYGFAEMHFTQRDMLIGARRVANPGCYPTGGIALIRPLVDDGFILPDYPISVNAVSGYSGVMRLEQRLLLSFTDFRLSTSMFQSFKNTEIWTKGRFLYLQ